jgi:hypothetical protein
LPLLRPYHADAQSASLRENRPSRDLRAFLRKAISPWTAYPAEGRAPHARNVDIRRTQTLCLFGHQPFARPSVIMKCPGLRPALPRGRAERVPPRKPPIARSPGLPPQGHLASNRPPGEERAPHARKRPSPSLDPSSRRLYHGAKFPPRQAKGAPG